MKLNLIVILAAFLGRQLVRNHLNLRSFYLCSAVLLVPGALFGQQAGPVAGTQQPDQTSAPAKKSTVPDYPDPRTLTVGIFGWATLPSPQPNLIGGVQAVSYSTLDGLGKQHPSSFGVEASYPITRTGELHFEGFEAKGDGSQDAPTNTTLFSTGYTKGTYLSTQYQIRGGKLYLEDLLHPFKFPVEKFRLKSLWEVQYVTITGTIDAPLAPATADSSGSLIATSGTGSRDLILPTFGLAAEYAVSPHVLLRGAATGFGIPHHSELWDAEGTISYRRKVWEFRAGYKVLHFKTSPQKDEYFTDTLSGGFVGVRYHWQ